MIGFLEGVIALKKPPIVVINLNGVGYELLVSMQTYYRLPELLEKVTLHTHLSIREDAHVLYGFIDEQERQVFRHLLRVNGVGPKSALSILSKLTAEQFLRAVEQQLTESLIQVPGIGKKTAQRIIMEIKDRLEKDPELQMIDKKYPLQNGDSIAFQDAVQALIALGYKDNHAEVMIRTVYEEGRASEELIRRALRQVVPA